MSGSCGGGDINSNRKNLRNTGREERRGKGCWNKTVHMPGSLLILRHPTRALSAADTLSSVYERTVPHTRPQTMSSCHSKEREEGHVMYCFVVDLNNLHENRHKHVLVEQLFIDLNHAHA